jgi:hypothetical protein
MLFHKKTIKGPLRSFFLCFLLSAVGVKAQSARPDETLEDLVLDLRFDSFEKLRTQYPDSVSLYAELEMLFIIALAENSDKSRKAYLSKAAELVGSEIWETLPTSKRHCIRLERAAIQQQEGDQWSSAWNAYKGLKGIQHDFESDPGNTVNQLLFGLQLCLTSFLPENQRNYAAWMGLEADASRGMELIRSGLDEMDPSLPMKRRMEFIYHMMMLQEKRADQIDPEKWEDHFLSQYIRMRYAAAMKNGDLERSVLIEMTSEPGRYQIPHLFFLLGRNEVRSRLAEGRRRLNHFLDMYDGTAYRAAAMHYLAMDAQLNGDYKSEREWRRSLLKETDFALGDDQLARRESLEKIPDELLHLRFALDVGDLNKVEDCIGKLNIAFLVTDRDKEEFLYRRAQWFEMSKDPSRAIPIYERIIEENYRTEHYYYPQSCVNLIDLQQLHGFKCQLSPENLLKRGSMYPLPYPYHESIREKLSARERDLRD